MPNQIDELYTHINIESCPSEPLCINAYPNLSHAIDTLEHLYRARYLTDTTSDKVTLEAIEKTLTMAFTDMRRLSRDELQFGRTVRSPERFGENRMVYFSFELNRFTRS